LMKSQHPVRARSESSSDLRLPMKSHRNCLASRTNSTGLRSAQSPPTISTLPSCRPGRRARLQPRLRSLVRSLAGLAHSSWSSSMSATVPTNDGRACYGPIVPRPTN
jgi:hypothetical protein